VLATQSDAKTSCTGELMEAVWKLIVKDDLQAAHVSGLEVVVVEENRRHVTLNFLIVLSQRKEAS
jgi:hypothetical protein